ncbi:hypothetical protein MYX78_05595 [Acidobacteria bacterium AH-259-G07]|nr:hypothetical protein [Acidobacteria bacterium AH-259-G07]
MKIRWQRVLIYFLGGICCWLLLFVWNERHIKKFHLETLRKSLQHQAHMMEMLFSLSDLTSDSEVDTIRPKTPYNITIIDRQGRVVADSLFSGKDLDKIENQLNQKEIIQAAQEGLGSDLRYYAVTDGWFLYAAVPFSNGKGFVRLSTPVSGP